MAKSGDFVAKFGEKWRFWAYIWRNCGDFGAQICVIGAPKVAILEAKVGSFEKIKLETLDLQRHPGSGHHAGKWVLAFIGIFLLLC